MAPFGVIVGASLVAVGAGLALAAFRKPTEHLAAGHLVGLSLGIVPEGRLNFVPAYPMALQGEQLVPFSRV